MKAIKIIFIVLLLLSFKYQTNAQYFHLILVCDTLDYSIGVGVKKNYIIVNEDILKITKALNIKLNTYPICGKNFNVSKINQILTNIQVNTDDIIFFYYSGHGVSSKTKWPSLLISNGSLDLSTIHKKLKDKNPKLLLTFADCCNYSNTYASNSKNIPVNQTIEEETNELIDNRKSLFLSSTGNLIACGSKAGFSSYNDFIGGFYTVSFFLTLNKTLRSTTLTNWNKIFETASDLTMKNAVSVGKVQEPTFEVNLSNIENPNDEQLIYHTLKYGETLSSIGRLYNVTYLDIAKWNKIQDVNNVITGTILIIHKK